MAKDSDRQGEGGRQGRLIALVIAGTGVVYVVAQSVGLKMGLDQRMLALIDLMALGGFLWCLVTTWILWRKRRAEHEEE